MTTAIRVTIIGVIATCQHLSVQGSDIMTYPPDVPMATIEHRIDAVSPVRPRLFARAENFATLRKRAEGELIMERLVESVRSSATALQEVPPITRTLQGRRLLGQSRLALERIGILAMAWHLDGNEAHWRRAEQEMLAIAGFADWNPSHFLDVAEMTLAMAIGYDWLYDVLPESSRELIRNAIVENALELPLTTHTNAWWLRAHNNWGQVCHAGLTAGALAVLEDHPDLTAQTVHNAIHMVTHSMKVYEPRGSYPEGPGYWNYGTSFNVLLIDALESVLGTDFGLTQAPGFDQTGQFPHLVTAPSGRTFNYADGGSGRSVWPAVLWFGRRFDRPDWTQLEYRRIEQDYAAGRYARRLPGERLAPFTLLWLDRIPDEHATLNLPLAWHSGCPKTPVAIFRSDWNDPDATFFGLKGGSPSDPHGHMDIGSFVLDADGVRWAMDFGIESYHPIEARGMSLWNMRQDSDRWRIFRINHLSHNIPLINGQPQRVDARGPIDRFSDDTGFPFAQIDLTSVYEGQAESIRRGIALLPGGAVLIRDELEGVEPGAEIRWAMLTPADPDALGEKDLLLKQRGQTLRLLQPGEGSHWSVVPTDPPPSEWDSPNPGTRLVALFQTVPEDGRITFTVIAAPGSFSGTLPEDELLHRSLKQW